MKWETSGRFVRIACIVLVFAAMLSVVASESSAAARAHPAAEAFSLPGLPDWGIALADLTLLAGVLLLHRRVHSRR